MENCTSGGGFQLRGADLNFNSRCISTFQSFEALQKTDTRQTDPDDSSFKVPAVPPVQKDNRQCNKRKPVNNSIHKNSHRNESRDRKSPYKKYVKYSLASVDSTGQYDSVRGDSLNAAVALDFLDDLKKRRNNSDAGEKRGEPEKQGTTKYDSSKVIMPEFSFGRKLEKKRAVRKVSDGESCDQNSENVKSSCTSSVQLSHLMDEEEDI